MPASNVTRVRRLGRWKSMARVRPTSGGRLWRRVTRTADLSVAASSKMPSISPRVRSPTLSRSRPSSEAAVEMAMPQLENGPRAVLALGVLRRLAGPLEAVLLALLHPRVARQEAGLAKWQPVGLGVHLQERPSDAVADGPRLAGHAAAFHLDHRVVAALGAGHAERHPDLDLVHGIAEVLVERPAVDDDLAFAGQQPDASDRRLATARPREER